MNTELYAQKGKMGFSKLIWPREADQCGWRSVDVCRDDLVLA